MRLILDNIDAPLYVITALFNPKQYSRRWHLYYDFKKHIEESGAKLITVEAAFGERDFAVTNSQDPFHIQVRTKQELWIKENLINIGISRLPSDWKYLCWIDADIRFSRPDWVKATIHQLQHYQVIQLFSEAQDLNPSYEPFQRHESFCASYDRNRPLFQDNCYAPNRKRLIQYHPGFAWAARREAIEAVGGLLDTAILGAGDYHMAKALIGKASESYDGRVTDGYKKAVLQWQAKAECFIKREIGYLSGLITHFFHGSKKNRYYANRWQILTKHGFDPEIDLHRNAQGLLNLHVPQDERVYRLRDDIKKYFSMRNEDDLHFDDSESTI
jgi:hypothetical protein